MDALTCTWPFPPCSEPAAARIIYDTPKGAKDKSVCASHFRQIEAMLWARGMMWSAVPVGNSRKVLALKHRAQAEDLANREVSKS